MPLCIGVFQAGGKNWHSVFRLCRLQFHQIFVQVKIFNIQEEAALFILFERTEIK